MILRNTVYIVILLLPNSCLAVVCELLVSSSRLVIPQCTTLGT